MRSALTLPEGRRALLLIDLQEEHRRDERYLVEGYAGILANAARLLTAARAAGVPVIHAAYERDFTRAPLRLHEPTADDGRPWFSALGDPMTAICPEVAPDSTEPVLRKNDMSCYSEAEFADILAETDPEWLVVAGVWTEACVGSTVRDALADGRRVALVKDACGSGTAAMHQSGLLHLANRLYGGAVVSTDDAAALLKGEERTVWQLVGAAPIRFAAETIAAEYDAL